MSEATTPDNASDVGTPFDSRFFRDVLGSFPTGVTIVTAATDDGPVGMTIGSFTSVSLDPPLVAFLPGKSSSSWAAMETAGSFCVNILSDEQKDLCGRFAGKDPDKFAGTDWSPADGSGAPIFGDVLGWIDCSTDAVHDAGDHVIVVGRVLGMAVTDVEAGPLLFHKGRYGRLVDL